MKIVFLNRYQNTYERGAEIFVKELSKRLSRIHHVDIFIGKDSDSLRKVLKGGYDVVIPVNGRWQAIKMSFGRIFGSYKLLITGHSGRGWDDILNIFIAKPDIFVALTNQLYIWAKKWAWGSKVVKIPNGIDLERFNPKGDRLNIGLKRPVILSVGALAWYKYHNRLVKAISKLNIGSLLIVGKGEDKEKLLSLGSKLLGNRLKIQDFSYEDMPKVYRSADLFTLPSWDREAFGIVYLEALASGLGVVAPDDLSRIEIIGDAGILVNTTDEMEYAKALEEALNLDWSKKSRKQAEKFSWEKCAKKYEQVIKNLR